jgi:hypothetical protein
MILAAAIVAAIGLALACFWLGWWLCYQLEHGHWPFGNFPT